MNAMQKSVMLAGAVALTLTLGGCGSDGDGGGCANPNGPGCPGSPTPPPPTPAAPSPSPTPVAVPSATGYWDSEARRWHFRLEQHGSTITGQLLGYRDVYYDNPEHGDLAVSGTVSSTGAITFGCAAFGVNFEGQIESGSRMTGTLYDCGNGCRNYGDIMVKAGS
jgi:hypothetical protein